MGDEATKSSIPPKAKKRHITVENGGVALSWRTLLTALVVVLGGGGTVGGLSLASKCDVDEHVQESADEIEAKQKARDDQMDVTLEQHAATIKTNGKVIAEVKIDVNAIQKIQHQQYARDEARRVTKDIIPRSRREKAYDSMVDLNLTRLDNGKPPCANLDCSH
jgi:hypothetical protein